MQLRHKTKKYIVYLWPIKVRCKHVEVLLESKNIYFSRNLTLNCLLSTSMWHAYVRPSDYLVRIIWFCCTNRDVFFCLILRTPSLEDVSNNNTVLLAGWTHLDEKSSFLFFSQVYYLVFTHWIFRKKPHSRMGTGVLFVHPCAGFETAPVTAKPRYIGSSYWRLLVGHNYPGPET